ncbi:MAG: hypothetical protein HQL95_14175 [Magnetococcales bacterium]|nr:hypothetical protein [Magnetococcales bacterium]
MPLLLLPLLVLLWIPSPLLAESGNPPPLRTERISPRTAILPVHEAETVPAETISLLRQYLNRGDRLTIPPFTAPGEILGSLGERPLITSGDAVRIRFATPLPVGARLDILRPGPMLTDPTTSAPLGQLIQRLGALQIRHSGPDGLLAEVTEALQAIEPKDLLDLPRPVNHDFSLHSKAPAPMLGRIVLIRDGMNETATHGLVVVNLGRRHYAVQGLTLPVYRDDRTKSLPQADPTRQPAIGEAILIQVGELASLAVLTRTHAPIRRGDVLKAP